MRTSRRLSAELETLTELIRPVVQATATPVTVTLAGAVDAASFQELHDLVVARSRSRGLRSHHYAARQATPLTAIEAEAIVKEPLTAIEEREAIVKEPTKTKGRPRPSYGRDRGQRSLRATARRSWRPTPEADRKFVLDTLGKLPLQRPGAQSRGARTFSPRRLRRNAGRNQDRRPCRQSGVPGNSPRNEGRIRCWLIRLTRSRLEANRR